MDKNLSSEELNWLKQLDTDAPVKPQVPQPVAGRLVELGLAIQLAEGGMQLTDLGRDRIEDERA
jgi:hypothetical protein